MRWAARATVTSVFFLAWFRIINGLSFDEMRYHGNFPASKDSVLLLANHISWWDGIWVYLLNKRFWKRSFKVLMRAEELEKRPFLKHLGAIPLYTGRKQLESLALLQQLLSEPGQLVLFFPEARISSPLSPRAWENTLLKRLLKPEQRVAFLFQVTAYAHRPRPTSFHFVKAASALSPPDLEAAYRIFEAECQQQMATQIQSLMGETLP
jgi:1-acyl-sn-glycerol-3-phosphate acyltransferase